MTQQTSEPASAQVVGDSRVERERQMLLEAQGKGTGAKLGTYAKLSGPGWLQSAITLGGGSLAGSLYIGVIGGYELLWLQPVMMLLGVVMLSAIGYVTLSTGLKPFRAINEHINPVLGWAWLLAAMMANMVWAMPQFSLGTAAIQQNLLPGVLDSAAGKYGCVALLFVVATAIIWCYDSGGKGVKVFEIVLKLMVAVVVVSFFGVVVAMTFGGEGLAWGSILKGFVPNLSLLSNPADTFEPFLASASDGEYWREAIVATQRERMVTAAATAVGINMTFLLPYSMLAKGWDKTFRGLASFDLATGLFIPFLLATSCVVIASATQFHTKYDAGLVGEGERTEITEKLEGSYRGNLDARVADEVGAERFVTMSDAEKLAAGDGLPAADRQIAAMLVQRDAFVLALSLENLTGEGVAQKVFGIGVLGMALSTIIILMLINGFCLTEMLGAPSGGGLHRAGAMLPALTGAFGFLFLWGNGANFWLAVPTSMFGMVLLPIAYVTFFFMMNSRSLMGDAMLRGGKRVAMNGVMLVALAAATVGASWSIWSQGRPIPGTEIAMRWAGIGLVGLLILLAAVVHVMRGKERASG